MYVSYCMYVMGLAYMRVHTAMCAPICVSNVEGYHKNKNEIFQMDFFHLTKNPFPPQQKLFYGPSSTLLLYPGVISNTRSGRGQGAQHPLTTFWYKPQIGLPRKHLVFSQTSTLSPRSNLFFRARIAFSLWWCKKKINNLVFLCSFYQSELVGIPRFYLLRSASFIGHL